MQSSQSSPFAVAATSQNRLSNSGGENQPNRNENRPTQTALVDNNDGGENDQVDNGNLPLRVSSSCNDISEQRQRQELRQSLSSELQQQQPSSSSEEEVVLPATSSSLVRKSLFVLRPVHRYVDLVCICLSVVAYLLETTMNAALAIFGIGVGVGLVLGDSFRAAIPLLPAVQSQQSQQQQQGTTTAQAEIMNPRVVPNLLPAQ